MFCSGGHRLGECGFAKGSWVRVQALSSMEGGLFDGSGQSLVWGACVSAGRSGVQPGAGCSVNFVAGSRGRRGVLG